MTLHMKGDWSLLDTCPIPPLEEVLNELQAILTLFRCHSTINAADIVVQDIQCGGDRCFLGKLPISLSLPILAMLLPLVCASQPGLGFLLFTSSGCSGSSSRLYRVSQLRARLLGLYAPQTRSNKGDTLRSLPIISLLFYFF